MKPRREVKVDYYFNYVDNKTNGNLLTRTTIHAIPMLNDTVDQSKGNLNTEMTNNFFASYTEPLGELFKGTIMYNYKIENFDQDKSTYDFANGTYSEYRADLSNIFETNRNEHKAGLKFQFDKSLTFYPIISHQFYNSNFFFKMNACWLIDQQDLNSEKLFNLVNELIVNKEKLLEKKVKLKELIKTNVNENFEKEINNIL